MDIEKMFRVSPGGYPDPEPMTREEILTQYQRAFTVINQKLFNNELPPIEIDYAAAATDDPEEAGWLACFSFDTDRKTPPTIYLQFHTPPEQGINTDDINDLLHELIHYYCYLHDIKDCKIIEIDGKEESYHTMQFKKTAEAHGATCNYSDEESGYSDAIFPNNILWEIFNEL